ncbi:MAG: biotin--[acetyl-CoA-carboxylase] ligase [Treponema sp.]|jgi:BirA family biotin operon repressor/biotin-[acetyl-CoA-carboxylase] ligase|nr:biotin--[acetyl-CoA-carboxylase] ligase [Treponema sp.]
MFQIANPFGAPVYYKEIVSSTMEESRLLAARGEAHGTVIVADFQEQGRGRAGRPWLAVQGQNLFFTILLRFADFKAVPSAITLRTGLAVSLAIEDFAPLLRGQVKVKWPNDLMIFSKKTAGILTESDGSLVYIGIGVNVFQREFPDQIKTKATSIWKEMEKAGKSRTGREKGERGILLGACCACGFLRRQRRKNPDYPASLGSLQGKKSPCGRFFGVLCAKRNKLLGHILARLHKELTADRTDWRSRLEERLFKKDEQVRFIPGGADSPLKVEGILRGIGPEGGLIIEIENDSRSFITGELDVYE